MGGLTIVDVDTEEDAKMWGSKIAVACGWPQEIRKFKD
jgi:nitrogen fixation protein